jgi:integrase
LGTIGHGPFDYILMSYKSAQFIRPFGPGFRLDIPAKQSPSGQRIRERFDTEALANGRAKEIFVACENVAIAVSGISPESALDAVRGLALLESYPGITLLDCVRGHLETLKVRSASLPFGQMFDLYLGVKEKRSESHKRQLKWTRDKFASLDSKLACDVTILDLERIHSTHKASVRNAFMRNLKALFNWGEPRGYVMGNPILKIEYEETVKGETEIFEPEIVQAILQDCLVNDLELLPFRVFGLFCGVRPDGELRKLLWEDFDWTDQKLTLRAEITKKKRRRHPDVSDNALAWLEEYRRRGGRTTGLVMPLTPAVWRQRHRANWARVVGVDAKGRVKVPWIKQGMRHSYCSYWLVAHNNDTDGLVIQSGHESKEVMWGSYYRATTQAKAVKFWGIFPPELPDSEKLVAFSAPCAAGEPSALERVG